MFKSSILVNNCKYYCYEKDLIVTLNEDSLVTLENLDYFIKKANPKRVIIQNICSEKSLKDLFKIVKEIDYKNELIIDLNYYVSRNRYNVRPIIDGLNNKTYIDLKNIPNNVLVKCMGSRNEQNEFVTWAHNLNQDNKNLFIKLLLSEEKKEFLDQERIILKFYKEIINKFPNIMDLSKKERFTTIYDYFIERFPLATDCIQDNNYLKPGHEWAEDPVETYRNSRGVSKGRSNLLSLVVNNNLLRLNCTIVNGKKGDSKHTWNQFIDENDIVSDYDLCVSIKDCKSSKDMKVIYNHSYERVYPCVLDAKNGGRGEYFTYQRRTKLNLKLDN